MLRHPMKGDIEPLVFEMRREHFIRHVLQEFFCEPVEEINRGNIEKLSYSRLVS